MKNLLIIFTFLLSVFMTGCGSNSKPDGGDTIELSDVLELQAQEILQAPNGTDFSLTLPFKKRIAEAYTVELSAYSLVVAGGCNINTIMYTPGTSLVLDGALDSVETLDVTGVFDANCTPTGYTFTATQKVSQGNQSDTQQVNFIVDYDDPSGGGVTPPPVEDGYSFYNATTPLEISQANTPYQIKVQLLKDGYVAVGENVELQPFDADYGDVFDYEVTTGTDGYAVFTYTSPLILPPNGSSITLTADYFIDENTSIDPKEVVLNFNSGTGGGGTQYDLVNFTTPVEITYADQVETISVYVVDSFGIGVPGKSVTISTPAFGDMTSSTAITNGAGKAEFSYRAPSDLTGLTTTTVTMYFTENGITLDEDIVINVVAAPVGTSEYNLTNLSTPVNVSAPGEVKEISVQLIKNDGTPQQGRTIVAKSIPAAFGSISNVSVQTGADGYARFNYIAAATLTDGVQPLELYFDDAESGERITAVADINVSEANLQEYNLTNVTTPVVITYPNQVETISLNVVDDMNVGAAGKTLTISTPAFGDIVNATAVTNGAGKVEFSYQAPDDLTGLGSTIVTIYFTEDGITRSADVNITVVPAPVGTSEYNLTNLTTPVNVSAPGEVKEISVQLIKNDGTPQQGRTVVAKSIPAAFGSISNVSVQTGADGYARFTYIAAATLTDGVQPLELYFDDTESGERITAVADINVSEATPQEYNLTNVTTPVVITYPNQVETISLNVVDGMNVGVVGKTLTISTPAFGDIVNATAVTNAAGKVEFSYQAPADLTGLGSTIVTIYFIEDGITRSADVNITVSIAPIGASEYNLTNASTPLEVSYAKEIKEISVQLIKNDGTPQQGKTIVAKSIPAAFGSIENVTVLTGADGYARFTYIAADTLTDGVQPLELYFDDIESGERISAFVDINVSEQFQELPQVVVPDINKENNLTVNNELVELPIKVFEGGTNTPYSVGKVKVDLPIKVLSGVDVGSFEAYEVDIVNGVATFKYTGPNDLEGLIASGDLNSTFMFYHEDNPTNKEPVVMIYDPDPNAGYIPVNYELVINSEDGNMTMGLQEEKTFSVILKDDQGNQVPDSNMTSITITSKNLFVGKILDDGNATDSIVITGKNPVNFNVQTNTRSGLLPIDISVLFVDPNGVSKEMNQTINVVVYSGPATAMSISYVGVEHDTTRGKYIEKFAVTVVDAYNNRVNTQPFIAVGGMVEYAVDGSSPDGNRTETSPRLWYGKLDVPYGSLVPDGSGGATFVTPGGSDIFQYVDFFNDKLVLFGEGYVYEALGKWDIADSGNDSNLTLLDDYYGTQRDNLFYAVGHNFRQDLCAVDGREYVGAAKSDTYQIDSEGTALVEFEYDYHLTGKDVMLWVNLTGYQADTDTTTRIGEARKHTLRGNGLITPDSYTVAAGSTAGTALLFKIRHENVPEWYQNGHFGFGTTGKCTVNNILDSSNYDYGLYQPRDARECGRLNGEAYVELNVTNPTADDCTISLDGIAVSPEFN